MRTSDNIHSIIVFGIEFIDGQPPKIYKNAEVSIFDKKGSERGVNKNDLEAILPNNDKLAEKFGIAWGDPLKEMCQKLKTNGIDKIIIYVDKYEYTWKLT